LLEELSQFFSVHQTAILKGPHIQPIPLMPPLELGESLTVKIEMPELDLPNPLNENAPLALTRHFRDEKIGAG
jgi:hypothetical protein